MKCEKCGVVLTPDHKWAKIAAHTEGWYSMLDGRAWCPKHRPPWAPKTWRGKR